MIDLFKVYSMIVSLYAVYKTAIRWQPDFWPVLRKGDIFSIIIAILFRIYIRLT